MFYLGLQVVMRIVHTIIIIICGLSFSTLAQSDDTTLYVVTENVYPMNYLDQQTGEVKGFAADYIRDVLAKAKIDYQLEILPWSRAYNTALSRPNVLVFGLARTESREDKFIWLTELINFEFYLYGFKSIRDQIVTEDDNYLDSRIGVIRDDFNHTEMELAGYRNLFPADGHTHMANLLKRRRVDFIVTSSVNLQYFGIKDELNFKDLFRAKKLDFLNVPIFYALSKETNPQIIARLQLAIKALEDDPAYIKPTLQIDD